MKKLIFSIILLISLLALPVNADRLLTENSNTLVTEDSVQLTTEDGITSIGTVPSGNNTSGSTRPSTSTDF